MKGLIKNNIGGLLSGTALNLLVKLFSQLIALNIKWLSKVLGIFFQIGNDWIFYIIFTWIMLI